jgi:hypothetical protein
MTLADVAFWIAAISVVGIADAGVTLEQTSNLPAGGPQRLDLRRGCPAIRSLGAVRHRLGLRLRRQIGHPSRTDLPTQFSLAKLTTHVRVFVPSRIRL